MKRRPVWKLALLTAVPLVLFAIVAERHSWRPRTILPPDRKWGYRLLEFSPDGRYLNLISTQPAYAPAFYDLRSGRLFEIESLKGKPYLKFAGNHHIATGSHLYSFPEGKFLAQYQKASIVLGILPDGKTLLTHRNDREKAVKAWNIQTGQASPILARLPGKSLAIYPRVIHLLADKRTLSLQDVLFPHSSGEIEKPNTPTTPRAFFMKLSFWDIEKQKLLASIPVSPTIRVRPLASAANDICAVTSERPTPGITIEIWNYRTGRKVTEMTYASGRFVNHFAPSPDGTLLAVSTTGNPSAIELWDIKTRKVIRTWEEDITSGGFAFSPDGRRLAINSADGLKLWRIK